MCIFIDTFIYSYSYIYIHICVYIYIIYIYIYILIHWGVHISNPDRSSVKMSVNSEMLITSGNAHTHEYCFVCMMVCLHVSIYACARGRTYVCVFSTCVCVHARSGEDPLDGVSSMVIFRKRVIRG